MHTIDFKEELARYKDQSWVKGISNFLVIDPKTDLLAVISVCFEEKKRLPSQRCLFTCLCLRLGVTMLSFERLAKQTGEKNTVL